MKTSSTVAESELHWKIQSMKGKSSLPKMKLNCMSSWETKEHNVPYAICIIEKKNVNGSRIKTEVKVILVFATRHSLVVHQALLSPSISKETHLSFHDPSDASCLQNNKIWSKLFFLTINIQLKWISLTNKWHLWGYMKSFKMINEYVTPKNRQKQVRILDKKAKMITHTSEKCSLWLNFPHLI